MLDRMGDFVVMAHNCDTRAVQTILHTSLIRTVAILRAVPFRVAPFLCTLECSEYQIIQVPCIYYTLTELRKTSVIRTLAILRGVPFRRASFLCTLRCPEYQNTQVATHIFCTTESAKKGCSSKWNGSQNAQCPYN